MFNAQGAPATVGVPPAVGVGGGMPMHNSGQQQQQMPHIPQMQVPQMPPQGGPPQLQSMAGRSPVRGLHSIDCPPTRWP